MYHIRYGTVAGDQTLDTHMTNGNTYHYTTNILYYSKYWSIFNLVYHFEVIIKIMKKVNCDQNVIFKLHRCWDRTKVTHLTITLT